MEWLISLDHNYIVGTSMQIFMKNALQLQNYNAESHLGRLLFLPYVNRLWSISLWRWYMPLQKNIYFLSYLKRLLWNSIIQQHFNFVYSGWCPNLNKTFKSKAQAMPNTCIRFCLQLGSRGKIGTENLNK